MFKSIFFLTKPIDCSGVNTINSSQRHIDTVHSGTRNFTCDFCQMSFSRKDYLKRHIASVHKDQENIEMQINQVKHQNVFKIEWNKPEIDLKHEDEHNIEENIEWNEPEIDIKTGEEKQGQVKKHTSWENFSCTYTKIFIFLHQNNSVYYIYHWSG